MGLKDSSGLGSRGPFSSLIFFFIEFHLDIKLLCFFLECLIFLFTLPYFFFICLICFWFKVGCSTGGSMKVSLPLVDFSWYGLNSGCLGLTEGRGGGGGLVGLGGLVYGAGAGIGLSL